MDNIDNSKAIDTAVAYMQSGRYEDAGRLCQQIIQQNPNDGQALYLLGRIAAAGAKYDQAARYMEHALQFIPPQPAASLELGGILRQANRPEEAIPYLRDAAENLKSYESFRELGFSLASVDNYAEAEQNLKEALRQKPDCNSSMVKLARIAKAQGKTGAAIKIYEQLIDQDPKNPHSYATLIENHLMLGEPAAALAACERCLNVEPAYTRALAYKCIALSELGEDDHLHYLFNTEKFLRRIPAIHPPLFDSIEEFNAYMADFILSRADLKKDSPDYATVSGWHSEFGKLFDNSRLLGDHMHGMIQQALDEYTSHLPPDSKHPVIKSRPSETRLISWAVVMDHLGHEKTHIHPKMWIGGVYYVQLPGDFDSQPEEDAGHIVFGQGPEELHPLRKPETITLKPVEGDFVVFPGYFWHLTIPLQSHEKRICVAFDQQSTKSWGK